MTIHSRQALGCPRKYLRPVEPGAQAALHGGYGCQGSRGWEGRLGGRAKPLPLGRGNSRHDGLGGFGGGLRQTNLVRRRGWGAGCR